MLERISDGRTDLVFDYLSAGHPADSTDAHGVSLIKWCAYHGDVSAIRHLLAGGETLESLGENYDLNGAVFHGHWRLCQFLVERGADVNYPQPDTGETPLHAALCKTGRPADVRILKTLLPCQPAVRLLADHLHGAKSGDRSALHAGPIV